MSAPAAAPVAASACSKRKADEAPSAVPASKVAKPLDAEGTEEDRLEFWMEPRFCCDWTIVVELEGYTLRAHVHRMQLSKASPEWWADRIQEHQRDHPTESTITFKRGEGPWENRSEFVLYLQVVYAPDSVKQLTTQFLTFNTAAALPLERLLHACDFTHFTSGFAAAEQYIQWLIRRQMCPMSRCIRLAERYRWKWIYDSFIESILAGDIQKDEMRELWASPTVAAAIGPLLADKATQSNTMVERARSARRAIQKYDGATSYHDFVSRIETILDGDPHIEEEEE